VHPGRFLYSSGSKYALFVVEVPVQPAVDLEAAVWLTYQELMALLEKSQSLHPRLRGSTRQLRRILSEICQANRPPSTSALPAQTASEDTCAKQDMHTHTHTHTHRGDTGSLTTTTSTAPVAPQPPPSSPSEPRDTAQ
jgi:hypothetical protein